MPHDTSDHDSDQKARVAAGAGQALLGRLGALIEALSIVAFTWAYGVATFGLYAVLWSALKVLTGFCDLAMPLALQRFVPRESHQDGAHTLGVALKVSVTLAIIVSSLLWFFAPSLALWVNAGDGDAAHVADVIRLYVWTLPFWVLVEVGTAAIRAKRTFGPEIRVRIFYEQALRLIIALSLWWAGFNTYGLFAAHLVSVALAALLTLRLVVNSYNAKAMIKATMTNKRAKERLAYGLMVMPSTMIKHLFSEAPVMALNALLPGVAGAQAAAFYAIARKLSSVLQLIRLAFDYVMAPLSAEKMGAQEEQNLAQMIRFSTRLALALGLPLYGVMIFLLPDLFSAFRPELSAAILATMILLSGRALEILAGPSASLVEVGEHPLLPSFNALSGLLVMTGMLLWLAPIYGVEGAAISAATGLNVNAFLATLQAARRHSLYGWLTARYMLVALPFAALPILAFTFDQRPEAPWGVAIGLPYLLISLAAVIRFGFTTSDAAALGRIGRRIKGL